LRSAWAWDARRKQYYLHNFLTSQPDLNYHNAQVQDWALQTLRFWLERGVDGFRFDTVNYFFHDPLFRDNPADYRVKAEAEANPYGMQYHLFDKNQPQNLAWIERIRVVLDEYGAASVGEMGESHHAIRMMGEYTAPGRLHQCYSFELMGYDYTPAFFRDRVEGFFHGAPDGWPMWAFSNHDVPRHVTRWLKHGESPDVLAKQAAALLLSFEGSICLWQGEELGQTDTELAFEELTDPQGIAFWPEPVGRDNTRTPMVWDASAHGGFSAARPWLPVKAEQAARHVAGQTGVPGSVLEHYRAALAFRKGSQALRAGKTRFLDLDEPLLGLLRGEGDGALLCLFNLSPVARVVTVTGVGALVGPSLHAGLEGDRLTLGPNAAAFLPVTGTLAVQD
jgi:alpha-glucosidase